MLCQVTADGADEQCDSEHSSNAALEDEFLSDGDMHNDEGLNNGSLDSPIPSSWGHGDDDVPDPTGGSTPGTPRWSPEPHTDAGSPVLIGPVPSPIPGHSEEEPPPLAPPSRSPSPDAAPAAPAPAIAAEVDVATPSLRRVTNHPDSFTWGPGDGFVFTWTSADRRPPNGSWQALCRYHKLNKDTACTQSMSANMGKELTKRLLKLWCLQAPLHTRKKHHANIRARFLEDVDEEILQARVESLPPPPEELLDDDQLDELEKRAGNGVTSGEDSERDAAPAAKGKAKAKGKARSKAKPGAKPRAKQKGKASPAPSTTRSKSQASRNSSTSSKSQAGGNSSASSSSNST